MISSAGPLVSMTSRYLSCESMSWFKGSLGIHVLACAASSVSSIIRPSWRSTTDTPERHLKLQSPHALSSPENTGGFPTLVLMIPRTCLLWCTGSLRCFHWRCGQELFSPQPLYLLQIAVLFRPSLPVTVALPQPEPTAQLSRSGFTMYHPAPAPLPCQLEISQGLSRALSIPVSVA